MKNPQLLVSKADVHDYVRALWKTDVFRDSHQPGGFVFDIVEQFALLPRIFAWMTNDHLERAHFSTWWGVMMHRDDYTNPVVSDLYWLHEIYHAATMPYIPGIGKGAFNAKMRRNENEASTFSEIEVYFELLGLREASFEHEIYADRFLKDPKLQLLWNHNKRIAIETFRTVRLDVMVSKAEHEMDEAEMWIRRFDEQNAAYSVVWSDRYSEIETRMAACQTLAMAGDRANALNAHIRWIDAEASLDPIDHVPFRLEAELFSPFYWANKKKFADSVAEPKPRNLVAM